jgi:hypothetical protein
MEQREFTMYSLGLAQQFCKGMREKYLKSLLILKVPKSSQRQVIGHAKFGPRKLERLFKL